MKLSLGRGLNAQVHSLLRNDALNSLVGTTCGVRGLRQEGLGIELRSSDLAAPLRFALSMFSNDKPWPLRPGCSQEGENLATRLTVLIK